MKSLTVKLRVILIGLIIFSYAEVWGGDWIFLAAEDDGTFWWYDVQGITIHPNKIFTMWVKKIKAKDILEIIKSEAKINPFELEKIASERPYERSFMEIDCIKKTFNNLQIFNYDSKGVLKNAEVGSKIKNILPGSVVETIYNAGCK